MKSMILLKKAIKSVDEVNRRTPGMGVVEDILGCLLEIERHHLDPIWAERKEYWLFVGRGCARDLETIDERAARSVFDAMYAAGYGR